MKRISLFVATAAVMLMAASPAQAHLVTFQAGFDSTGVDFVGDGFYLLDKALGSTADELAFVQTQTGVTDLSYLNKYNYPDPEKGTPGGFEDDGAVDGGAFNPSADADDTDETKTLTWDLSGTDYGMTYVFIKDGKTENPDGKMLYRLYAVTADQYIKSDGDEVSLIGFGAYEKGVSHVMYLGTDGPPVFDAPDGGMTLTLLGCALVGIGALRRKFGA
jgi:hypothetical protein